MRMMKFARIAGAALVLSLAATLTSCETTGDPTQGGLFGWSEDKAQDRLYNKRAQLGQAQSRTDSVNESNWKLHAQRENLR